jgi:hypothetical protein
MKDLSGSEIEEIKKLHDRRKRSSGIARKYDDNYCKDKNGKNIPLDQIVKRYAF